MKRIEIKTGKPYEVIVSQKLPEETSTLVRKTSASAVKAAVISDSNVAPLYLGQICKMLEKAGLETVSKVIPAGEQSKNLSVYGEILGFLASSQITRSDVLIALGGGVVGDLTGFASATFLRGLSYIQIPTSLLAMVDSSVGGKTAVDLPEGKNLAGAFCQPELVLCASDFLNTLKPEMFRDGCAEVIKYGILEDEKLYAHLLDKGLGFDRQKVIARCIEIKGDYVSRDEFDTGDRRKLNLGHTFGHAIEAASNFGISHGEGVAIGTCMIARAAASKGYLAAEQAAGIESCIEKFGLPTRTDFKLSELLPYVASDKKRRGDSISLIVPDKIGHCSLVRVKVDEISGWMSAGM